MLTRRQIRVKVVQAAYAQYNGNALSLAEGVKAIQRSCKDIELLYFTHILHSSKPCGSLLRNKTKFKQNSEKVTPL